MPELRAEAPSRAGARSRRKPGRRGGQPGASIVVDARGVFTSGIGRYLREVLQVLFADPRFGRIRLLGAPEPLHDFCATVPGREKADVRPYPYGFYSPAAQAAWLRLRASGVASGDVAFFPHYDAPLLALPERSVVTVQDLIHFKVPEAFPLWRRRAAGLLLRRAVGGAGRVLVTSESTRRDLVERFPGCERKLDVVPLGVSPFFAAAAGAGAPPPRVEQPYLLCVGNRKPHKNLAAAVETLARLRGEAPELRLAIVGEVFRGWDDVLQRAGELGVGGRIVEVAGATDVELRALYAGCEALIFPSLYEGFGLPVLEAMAAGAPVVASNRSSVPEVVGDAGLLADPEDPRAIAEGVLRLRREPALRAELVRRGRERAASFTWERSARGVADVLFRVAGGQE
ncbi:MAG TPA: glycosyltransferase family 1 protein [Longimicrobiaceae bacterium]|nr:glycosyltransferase family 1 protein [Longimicrobiaceae bacterium]